MSVINAVPLVCLLVSSLAAVASFVFSFRCLRPLPNPLADDLDRTFRQRSAFASVVAIGLLFALTRLKREPFSPGQGLGIGLLLGGVFALVSCWLRVEFQSRVARSLAVGEEDGESTTLQALHLCGKYAPGELGLVVAPIATVLWQIRDDPTSALMGCAIGMLVVRILAGFGAAGVGRSGLTDEMLGVFGVALSVATYLAVMHDLATTPIATLAQRHLLWMLPLLVATMMTITAMFTNRFVSTGGLESRVTGVALVAISAAMLNLGATIYLSLMVYKSPLLLPPLAAGALLSLFVFAFTVSAQASRARDGALGFIVAGLALVVWAESFRRLAGYGIALAGVGALSMSGLAVALSLASDATRVQSGDRAANWAQLAQRVTMAVGLLASISLARIFFTNVHLRQADMSIFSHYLLMGLAVGAVTPLILLSARTITADREVGSPPRLLRAVLAAGVIGMSVFFVVVLTPLFFRVRSSAGLMVGLVIAQATLMFIAFSGQFVVKGPPARWTLPPVTLFTLGCGVLGAQLGPLLAAHSGMLLPAHKLALSSAMLIAAFLWFVLSGKTDEVALAGDRE